MITPCKNEDFHPSLKGDELRNSFLYVNLIPPPNPVRKQFHDHFSKKSLSVLSQFSMYPDGFPDYSQQNIQLLKP